MVKPKNPHSYANSISMSRSLYKGTYLIVEGESDEKLFKKFIEAINCRVKGIPTKDLATRVLKILEKRKEIGILLVVDADFDNLNKIKPNSKNMFYTDNHDIETMIISSQAFENFLREFTIEDKLSKFEKKISMKLKDILIISCLSIGYVRWASINNKWSLKFRNLEFNKFISSKNLKIDYNKFIIELIRNSPRNTETEMTIKNQAILLNSRLCNPLEVCSGHDLTQILLIGLKKTFGYNIARINRYKLESMLRLSYEFRFFKTTNLYRMLVNWQNNNSPFTIF